MVNQVTIQPSRTIFYPKVGGNPQVKQRRGGNTLVPKITSTRTVVRLQNLKCLFQIYG